EPLRRADLAGAAAGRAGDRLAALFAAAAVAGLTARRARHAHRCLLAGEGLLQRDRHVVAQVGAAPARLAAAAAAHEVAEHLVEDSGEAGGGEVEAGAAEAARPGRAVLEGGMAEAVIGGTLLLVLEDVVGLADFLELVFARLVARVAVRVKLH